MGHDKKSLLEVQDLVVQYITDDDVVEAVNGIDLRIDPGESLGLVGETGAGKTTTALSILGIIPHPPGKVVSGTISFDTHGDLLQKTEKQLRGIRGSEINMIFQDPMTSLNPSMTVGDQIVEVVRLHGKVSRAEACQKAQEMLELVGIPGGRYRDYPHQFSGGMKQRVMIAIALACNPKLLIADEPTTALDVTIQAQVLELINDLKKKLNTAVLLITHDLGVVAETCERVAIMYAGEIVESGLVRTVFKSRTHPYTEGLFKAIPDISKDSDRLQAIHGMIADPTCLPKGCKYHPRCPYTQEQCRSAVPPSVEVAPGHFVKCHRYCSGEAPCN